jgi:hypothetical protein
MLLLSLPHKSALAGMVGTETVLDITRSEEARDYLNKILAREDIQASLIAQGIDPLEAKARAESLSDAEVVSLADQIEELPAGGSALGIILGTALIVFLVLLITDILGYTDIFPFVKKHSEVKKDSDNK